MEKQPPKFEHGLPVFVADLRSLVFSSQSKMAEYVHVKPPTISRYENGVHFPPPDYLACLAKLVVERQGVLADESYRKELLRQVNRAVKASYVDEVPFESWEVLDAIAENYLAQQQASGQADEPAPTLLPHSPEPPVNWGPAQGELSHHRNGTDPTGAGKETRVDRFQMSLVLVWLASLGAGLSIGVRFWGSPLDGLSFGVMVGLVFFYSAVALIILKPVGEPLLPRVTILRSPRREIKVGLVCLLGAFVILAHRIGLFKVAVFYNEWGVEAYQHNQLAEAKAYFERAIKLAPDLHLAHYNLGSVYEVWAEYELARHEYRLAAIEGDLDLAYNNLARLYILDRAYADAITLLKQGLIKVENEDVKYDIFKNLGWAYLEQGNQPEAEKYLREAVALKPDQAPAHCLIAELLERRQRTAEALAEWEACLTYANREGRDIEPWIKKAQERLSIQ